MVVQYRRLTGKSARHLGDGVHIAAGAGERARGVRRQEYSLVIDEGHRQGGRCLLTLLCSGDDRIWLRLDIGHRYLHNVWMFDYRKICKMSLCLESPHNLGILTQANTRRVAWTAGRRFRIDSIRWKAVTRVAKVDRTAHERVATAGDDFALNVLLTGRGARLARHLLGCRQARRKAAHRLRRDGRRA